MRFRDKVTLHLAPLVLRVALGVVFIWAGSSKLLHTDPFNGDRAARLANMGIIRPTPAPGPVSPVVPDETPAAEQVPLTPQPVEPPVEQPAAPPPEDPQAPKAPPGTVDPAPPVQGAQALRIGFASLSVQEGAPIPPAPATPEADQKPAAPGPTKVTIGTPPKLYTAADFDRPVSLRRLYNLVLLLDSASRPNAQGRTLWPAALSKPVWLERAAWAAALTEFIGGILLLLGLLTRLSALGILGTMVTAMWLTQIGPMLGRPDAVFGFLPDPAMSDPSRWNSLTSGWLLILWQGTLGCIALALVLSGPGRLSMDSLIFRRGSDAADDERELARRKAAASTPPRPI